MSPKLRNANAEVRRSAAGRHTISAFLGGTARAWHRSFPVLWRMRAALSFAVLSGCGAPQNPEASSVGARAYQHGRSTPYRADFFYRAPTPGQTVAVNPPATRPALPTAARPVRRSHRGQRSLTIPPGAHCLSWLDRYGVRYRPLGAKAGMVTPVAVSGPIGGVDYVSAGKSSVVGDCRLIVALQWIAPELRALGVRTVRHSGAYVYRTTRKGRLSLHALGLAIDLHAVEIAGQKQDVKHDYKVGMRDGCRGRAPALNHLACWLDTSGLFQELLTPDDNRDHHDHLHLAIAPL